MQFIHRHFPKTRLRRLRSSLFLRDLIAETQLTPQHLIYPIFVMEESEQDQHIPSLPGIVRFTQATLLAELTQVVQLKIGSIALFPVISASKKTPLAEAAYDPEGLVPQTVRLIKTHFPMLGVITDVALDPYTSHGQDGLCDEQGIIMNDLTLPVLVKQALVQAQAGADIIAPSDMMDGRIGVIRHALEAAGCIQVGVLAYAAKYASAFYQPFRQAVGSLACLERVSGNSGGKATYQLDYRNSDAALHEVALDLEEGADIVMVKPGLPYLDIVRRVKDTFHVPTFVYQVSGEYAMLKAAAQAGYLDERAIVLESLMAIKRAGADAILTYFAKQVAEWLSDAR